MRKLTKTIISLTSAALIGAGFSAPAMANDDNGREERSVTVSYGDLNLASEAGAKRLESRIRYAARTVCGPRSNRNITAMADYRSCYKSAMAGGKKAMVILIARAKSGDKLAKNSRITIG